MLGCRNLFGFVWRKFEIFARASWGQRVLLVLERLSGWEDGYLQEGGIESGGVIEDEEGIGMEVCKFFGLLSIGGLLSEFFKSRHIVRIILILDLVDYDN